MNKIDLELEESRVSEERPGLMPSVQAQLPFVTVVVPCLNEEKYISRCLDSILANDYPKERMEVLVVDALSEDKTREIVKGYAERYPFIRLVNNPEKHIPVALNLGIHHAQGDTIIKMDAHSTYQPDHISLCVRYQDKYGAENVGGVWKMMPGADTTVARAIVLGLGHRFGSRNAAVKIGVAKPTWSDTAAFGCFKKGLFSRVGFFDERLLSSSDLDMNMRIRAAGGRILLVPQIVVNYYADPDLRAFWNHNFADGIWATYVLKFGSKGWAWRHWAPLAFVLGILIPAALATVEPALLSVGLAVLAMYLITNLAVSLRIAHREKNWKFMFLMPLVFGIRHLAHGLGALFGLVLAALPGERWQSGRWPRTPRKRQM